MAGNVRKRLSISGQPDDGSRQQTSKKIKGGSSLLRGKVAADSVVLPTAAGSEDYAVGSGPWIRNLTTGLVIQSMIVVAQDGRRDNGMNYFDCLHCNFMKKLC